jgi:hypothetical protein
MQEAERHNKITDYIISHLFCLTEDLCKAMEEHMARSTFFKDLAKLKVKKIVCLLFILIYQTIKSWKIDTEQITINL